MVEQLRTVPAAERPDLLADPVAAVVAGMPAGDVLVAEIDPGLADTAEFCAHYGMPLDTSANCVIIAGRVRSSPTRQPTRDERTRLRGGEVRYAACVVLATTRADVNGVVRRRLDVRKASFAPMDAAVSETGMEYGGITPLGLPAGWPLLVDAAVADAPQVVVGSGVRRSKLLLPGKALLSLPNAEVIDGLATPVPTA
jgi:prolyl-tRNA editing enzyme YbaK/EbsC (Cys-tRNA(Pro) deacylase)